MDLGIVLGLLSLGISSAVAVFVYSRYRGGMRDASAARGSHEATHLYAIAAVAWERFQAAASPEDVLRDASFMEGVRLLEQDEYPVPALLGYFTGDNVIIACMALEALTRKPSDDELIEPILAGINEVVPWTRYFALRVLLARVPGKQPLVGRLLTQMDRSWTFPVNTRILRDFLRERIAAGEVPTFAGQREELGEVVPGADHQEAPRSRGEWLAEFLSRLGPDAEPLLAEIDDWSAGRVDTVALEAIGSVWPDDGGSEDAPVSHPELELRVATIETELRKDPPRSVLVVGESGTGKTTAIRALGRRLQRRGWTIFEAGHSELLAGMTYMGQIEDRLRGLSELLGRGRRVLWIVPDFHALSWAGRHQHDFTSVLDYLLPGIERGNLKVVGETTPAGYERMVQSKPRCRTALGTLRLEPLAPDETLQLARDWIAARTRPGATPIVADDTLREAWSLAQQFMGTRATPGSLLELLSITRRRMLAGGDDAEPEVRLDDLIVTLSAVTGLPTSILDERQSLDLTRLREVFESRVLGQQEVVDCLVERLSMIKAGVTDPTRPQGVFLLAGPTGTGKTEIGKALAQFLFGSSERMIRLDMSELQDEASQVRIFGDPHEKQGGDSLVEQIRKQPFSVVLLDEFEKANPRIWDLFLQVFDDGRLSDRLGRVADFRHALILMTSNLGASIPSGLGLGFVDRSGAFSADAVRREVQRVFRKEFLNRIDRTIVFRPLGRDTMRAILHKELAEVRSRRGLRNRQWAVEWDDAAIEFLLDQGFTADLGARPLKRAIERHLLAPLARTIVDHRFPEGDQFLFVTRAGSALQVRFIDPDAPDPVEADPEATAKEEPAAELRLNTLVLSPYGASDEVALLRSHHDGLVERIESAGLHRTKQAALEQTARPSFWSSAGRFSLLGRVEYLDRIEAGLQSAGSLLERLEALAARSPARTPARVPRELVGRLAQRLWLLEHACEDVARDRPREAWLQVDAGHESGAHGVSSNEFALRLGRMYRDWSAKRGMRLEVLAETGGDGQPYHLLLGISGYAAWALLEPEQGLHVWEVPEGKRAPARRCAVRVRVLPQPDEPVDDPRARARREIADRTAAPLEVVRRYREIPSPLVRDGRRGWRTGRLDRVLGGDFDLI